MRIRSLAATFAALALSASVFADTYKVDSAHSSVAFKIMHDGVAPVYGIFAGVTGSVSISGDTGSVELSVKADSVQTGVPARDTHLKSNDFFAVAQFPAITFKSTSFAKAADGTYDVTGDLTLHGVTKSVTVKLTATAEAKGMKGNTVRGFETTFSIKRSDFGINFGQGVVGDDVTLMVGVEGAE